MKYKLLALLAAFAFNLQLQAQEKQITNQDVVDVEELYKNADNKVVAPEPTPKSQLLTDEERKEFEAIKKNSDFQQSKMKSISELNKLSPFTDVSMIQRKFLPKTERFQIFGGLSLSTNSPWFFSAGGKLGFSYNFAERYGVEFSALYLSSFEKESAKEIRDNNSLRPDRFILGKSNLGLDFVWSPIYGKITTLDQKIVPFDMYFSFGGGTMGTNSTEKNVPAVHLATGQIFALSKALALRWDYSGYFYNATPVADSGSTTTPSANTYSDLILTVGVSFFFPEVNYR